MPFLWAMLLAPSLSPAQKTIESVYGEAAYSIPFDQTGVEKIETDEEGNIYLLAPGKHRISKILRQTAWDSIVTVGGKGIRSEGFNFPTRIHVPNRQSLYVLDFQNRRLLKLNVNLKVIREINFLTLQGQVPDSEVSDLFPSAFCIGPTGELFLFNQDDYKVYKFNIDGRFERAFAGLDFGAGSVTEPCDIAMNSESNVFIMDCEEQEVIVYDLYGMYLYRFPVPVPFFWTQAKVSGRTLIYLDEHNIYFYNTFTKNAGPHLQVEESIRDISFNGEFMFVLYENKVNLHRITKAE